MTNKVKEYLETHNAGKASREAKISQGTLLSVSRMETQELLELRLKTYLKIKHFLGVDLLEDQEFNLEN